MLKQFSKQVRECYERAVEAKAKADAINDPALEAEFVNAENHWLTLASSFVFSESLEDFTENSERRRKFDERLRVTWDRTGRPLHLKVRSKFYGPAH